MKVSRRFFIGFDSKTPDPYYVCRQSMIDAGVNPSMITPLILDVFKGCGWYWRDNDENASTEFTYTRFLVPFLSGFYGYSVFCDADFLWRKNPEILFDLVEDQPGSAVHVVKHDISPDQLGSIKMDGKVQAWYPKKNWSSLMVFNNAHPDCRKLVPEAVSTWHPSLLHQFKWTDNIGPGLPKTFNYLVGYNYDVSDPYAVHFTDGGPWLGEPYESVEYAKEWFGVQQKTERPAH